MYSLNLQGKTVAITGAAGGIGYECAVGFLENGCDVCLIDYRQDAIDEACKRLKERFADRKIAAVCADITSEQGVNALSEEIKAQFGSLDILLNNAGTGANVRSVNETRQGWERVVGLNLNAQFFVSQKLVNDFMAPAKKGVIVNMASLSAMIGVPNAVAYSSSKGGLLMMTKSLACEWARFNIRVNCVCPGFVETDLIKENMENERWMAYMNMRIAQRRLAKPQDVVGAVLFLASDLSGYITGTSIVVDGGFSSGS